MLTRDFAGLVLIAIVVASPLAWHLMHQWLQNFEYGIELNIWYFAGASLLTLSIAICTVGFQSYRAASANPTVSLKNNE